MAQDLLVKAEQGLFTNLGMVRQTGTALVVATSGTIPTTPGFVPVAPAAAVTSVVLTPGVFDGQICIIVNNSAAASTITFAAAGTSNVAGGVTDSIAGLHAHIFVWNSTTALWYLVGPVAN